VAPQAVVVSRSKLNQYLHAGPEFLLASKPLRRKRNGASTMPRASPCGFSCGRGTELGPFGARGPTRSGRALGPCAPSRRGTGLSRQCFPGSGRSPFALQSALGGFRPSRKCFPIAASAGLIRAFGAAPGLFRYRAFVGRRQVHAGTPRLG
jgi:hypothetical protein